MAELISDVGTSIEQHVLQGQRVAGVARFDLQVARGGS